MPDAALSIRNLTKTYSNNVEALKGIDLEVAEGDFFALLGPNGAGKSTAINIIINLVNKTSGRVEVFGHDIDRDMNKAKALIGVVPQEFNFNIFENVLEIVVNQAGYYGIPKKMAEDRAEKYLNQLELWPKRNDPAQTLSGGLKRRLMIARALVHEPELLILDEPTAGVDIEIRRGMWEFLRHLNTDGRTIILTTHYLDEAENLCRNIAIIDDGRIIENTSMKNMLRKMESEVFIFDTKNDVTKVAPLTDYDVRPLDDTTVEVEISEEQNLNQVFEHFQRQGIEVISMRRKSAKLEELFLRLVEKGKNDRR
jgi:ABC-2 type transport system ATP-binding protein